MAVNPLRMAVDWVNGWFTNFIFGMDPTGDDESKKGAYSSGELHAVTVTVDGRIVDITWIGDNMSILVDGREVYHDLSF